MTKNNWVVYFLQKYIFYSLNAKLTVVVLMIDDNCLEADTIKK